MNTPSHQLIKDVAALSQKKFRDETGLMLVEGRHPVEEALRAGLTLRHAFILSYPDPRAESENHLPQEAFPVSPFVVDEKTMTRLCSTTSPPPCLAVFEQPTASASVEAAHRALQKPDAKVLVLDALQDPGNLGTLARSAVAFGMDALILAGECVEPYNPKVIRASAGLIFALPVVSVAREKLTDLLAAADWKLFVTTGRPDALSHRDADYSGRCAVILGNEGRGVSPDLFGELFTEPSAPFADQHAQPLTIPLTIPMASAVESLNVAISGSIILAEMAARQASI